MTEIAQIREALEATEHDGEWVADLSKPEFIRNWEHTSDCRKCAALSALDRVEAHLVEVDSAWEFEDRALHQWAKRAEKAESTLREVGDALTVAADLLADEGYNTDPDYVREWLTIVDALAARVVVGEVEGHGD